MDAEARISQASNATLPVEAAALMRLLPGRPRILALGEPTHGEDTLLRLRNRLFRQLAEEAGYRTIAIESDCVAGLLVDDYVTGGAGTLDEVMARGFSHGWGAHEGNRELVRRLRTHNEGRPAGEQVHFAGMDGQLEITHAASPRQALARLYDYLAARLDADLLPCTRETLDELLGADDRWSSPDAMLDPASSFGRSAEAARLRLLADELALLLDTRAPLLIAETSRDDWALARLHARSATGLLRYHHAMADTSPARMARLCELRALMMADNILAAAERGPVLVHAANSHLEPARSTMPTWDGPVAWWSAGALVKARVGADYAFLATALGTLGHRGVDTPAPDTVEGLLYGLGPAGCLLDGRRLAASSGAAGLVPRVSPWIGYAPLDPGRLGTADGIVFVRDV